MEKIIVENLFKIFGPDPEQGMELIRQGLDKAAIYEKTGMTVGVCDASFTVNSGEIFVIMGLSGSGKSTIVRMLNRLIEPTSGRVLVDGKDVTAMRPDELVRFRLRTMSMVFQSFALMPHMTVAENAAFGLQLAKVDKTKRRDRAMQALAQAGAGGMGRCLSQGAFRRHAAAGGSGPGPGRGPGYPSHGRGVFSPGPPHPRRHAG